MSKDEERDPGITEEYEEKALASWRRWYQQTQPTIAQASAHAYSIARDAVGSLATNQVILLLEEHGDWTHQRPQKAFDSDRLGLITIGDIARRHLISHLEQVIQRRGLQTVCDQEEPGIRKEPKAMFDRLKPPFSPKKPERSLIPEGAGNTILFLYDETDRDLWYDLAPHLTILMMRLPDVFTWKYYYYRPVTSQNEGQREQLLHDLEGAFLFLPCTSVTFLVHFLQDRQKDSRLNPLLSKTYIQPIALRAAHGVTQSLLPRPLASYPAGPERSEACVQVVAALEEKLVRYRNAQAPVALLAEGTGTPAGTVGSLS